MLNFRKLRQDFSSAILKEGKAIHDKNKILSARVIRLDPEVIRFSAKILGNFDNAYESEIEIDRFESQAVHTNCDCPSRFDCAHLAALIFHLEEKIDSLLVEYSKGEDISKSEVLDSEEKKELMDAIREAECKEVVKQDARYQKQVLQEYVASAEILSDSPFFRPLEEYERAEAELAIILSPQSLQQGEKRGRVEFQMALRLPNRSKPLQIAHLKNFLDTLRYEEPLFVGGRKLCFSIKSFEKGGALLLQQILDHARLADPTAGDRAQRTAQFDAEVCGMLFASMYEAAANSPSRRFCRSRR